MRLNLSPISHSDEAFLFSLYASVREDEMALVPWNEEQKLSFLKFQFQAQHQHYTTEYPPDSFKIIELEGQKIGRLYICELPDKIQIIDLTLLPSHRGRGIGSEIISDILQAAQKPVRIYLESFNRSAALFERFGFRVIGSEGLYQLWERAAVVNQKATASV